MKNVQATSFKPAHFGWSVTGKVATISLNRPERKNPLTFESYGELSDLFRELVYASGLPGSFDPNGTAYVHAGMSF